MIVVELDLMIAQVNSRRQSRGEEKLTSRDIAEEIGIAPENLSRLKNGDFLMIRRTTLNDLCRILSCQPGDLFRYVEDVL